MPASRLAGPTLATLLAALAFYGLSSTPGLLDHWGTSPAGLALVGGWLVAAALILRAPLDRSGWAFVALLSVMLRFGSASLAAGRISPGDSQLYLELAQNLLANRGFVVHEPFVGLDVHGFYPPLYPLVLAGWGGIAGFSAGSLLILSSLIDGVAALLIARLGKRLGHAEAGGSAAALYLIWPSLLLSAPLAQKEGLATALIVTLALGWLRAADRPSGLTAMWIGAAAAGLALTQPGQAPLAGLFALALLPWLGWRMLRTGVPAAAVAALAMTPWWLRNALMFGRFVPLTTVSGLGLWVGSSKDATGGWMPYPHAPAGMGEIAYAGAMGGIARRWIVAHPLATLHLWAAKFVRALGVAQGGISRLAAMQPAFANTALLLPVSQASHLLLLAGGAAGTQSARSTGQKQLLMLIAACLVQLLVFALPFEFAERHREFLTPFLLLLVATASCRRRSRRSPTPSPADREP